MEKAMSIQKKSHTACKLFITSVLTATLASCGGSSGGGSSSNSSSSTDNGFDFSITSPAEIDITENKTQIITLETSDLGDKTASAQITGGSDASLFSITDLTLSANNPFDFENPISSDGDNNYEVTITITVDGSTRSKTFNIKIGDISIPELQVLFPAYGANLDLSAENITFQGLLIDKEDNSTLSADQITELSIGSTLPTIVEDHPQGLSWSLDIPVTQAETIVPISFELTDGQAGTINWPLYNTALLGNIQAIVNADVNEYYLADAYQERIISINTETLTTKIISTNGFPRTKNIFLDAEENRLLIASPGVISAVDLTSGERTLISTAGLGSGPNFRDLKDMDVDIANNIAYITDAILNAVFAVDLITGDRSIISDATIGTGEDLDKPLAIAFDMSGEQLFITGDNHTVLYKVDIKTGDRSVVSSDTVGTGEVITTPSDIKLDLAKNRVFILDETTDKLFTINLTTGERTLFAQGLNDPTALAIDYNSLSTPQLVFFSNASKELVQMEMDGDDKKVIYTSKVSVGDRTKSVTDIHITNDEKQIVAADSNTKKVYSMSLNTGERHVLSSIERGAGSTPLILKGLNANDSSEFAYIADSGRKALIKINKANGDRTIVSSAISTETESVGSGISLERAEDVVVDLTNNRGFIADLDINGVISIDINTGDRTILSSSEAAMGTGIAFTYINELCLLSNNTRLFAADRIGKRVIEVNLNTGDRTLISGKDETGTFVGSGYEPKSSRDLICDTTNNRLLVWDEQNQTIYAVNPETLEHTSIIDTSSKTPWEAVNEFTYAPKTKLFYGSNPLLDGIIALDEKSGQQAVISQ